MYINKAICESVFLIILRNMRKARIMYDVVLMVIIETTKNKKKREKKEENKRKKIYRL